MKKDWFTSWFDTKYYHILYKDRNDVDAELFMRNITDFIKLPLNSTIADIPCGKGRHSIFLNSLGYKVTGGDLSKQSIAFAKKFENESLYFEVWDMRKTINKKYDAIFNLFTSFGYFKDDDDDIKVLKSFKNGLKKDGILVLDFMNVYKVAQNLVNQEVKTIDGIDFHIKREIIDGFILKHINFTDENKSFSFTEQVKFLTLEKMQSYFKNVGLTITHTFGDYHLCEFNKHNSDRLILVAQ